jgi:hypothetical protein
MLVLLGMGARSTSKMSVSAANTGDQKCPPRESLCHRKTVSWWAAASGIQIQGCASLYSKLESRLFEILQDHLAFMFDKLLCVMPDGPFLRLIGDASLPEVSLALFTQSIPLFLILVVIYDLNA